MSRFLLHLKSTNIVLYHKVIMISVVYHVFISRYFGEYLRVKFGKKLVRIDRRSRRPTLKFTCRHHFRRCKSVGMIKFYFVANMVNIDFSLYHFVIHIALTLSAIEQHNFTRQELFLRETASI